MVITAIDYSVHEVCSSCSRNITRSPKLLDLFVMWFYMFNVEKTKAPEYVSSDAILISLHILLQHLVKKTISTDTMHGTHVPQARLHHKNLLKSTHFCRNTGPLLSRLYLALDCTKDHFLLLQHHAKYAKRLSAKGLF